MANINVRVDDELKKEAEEVLRELGIDFSTGIRIYLTKLVREQGIPFELSLKKTHLDQSWEDYEAGRTHTYDSAEDMMRSVLNEDRNHGSL